MEGKGDFRAVRKCTLTNRVGGGCQAKLALHSKDLANSCESSCALRAKLRALGQSPFAAAVRASAMNPAIFEAMSACAAFNVFPRVAATLFSASLRLAVASCCAALDSSTESCGTTNGFSGLLDSAGTGCVAATRGRGGRACDVKGSSVSGGERSSCNSTGSSPAFSSAMPARPLYGTGTCGRTTLAVLHGNFGR
jgi:hypothetical protein